jgi:hypothetical protein
MFSYESWSITHAKQCGKKNRKNFLRCALKRKASAYFVLHIAKCAFKNQEKVFFYTKILPAGETRQMEDINVNVNSFQSWMIEKYLCIVII